MTVNKKTMIFLPVVAILLSLSSLPLTHAADPLSSLGDVANGVIEWIKQNIIQPIIDGFNTYIAKPLFQLFGDIIYTVKSAVMQPFLILQTAWYNAYNWLQTYLGPLAPLALLLLAVAALVIIFYLIKWLVPGI